MKLRTLLIAAAGLTMAVGAAGAASAETPWQAHHPRRVEVNHRIAHLNRSIRVERREGELSACPSRALNCCSMGKSEKSMRRIGSLTEVNAGGRGAVPKTMRLASPTTATISTAAIMFVTLAIGDLVGMSEPVKRRKPDDVDCHFFGRASVRYRTQACAATSLRQELRLAERPVRVGLRTDEATCLVCFLPGM